MNHSNRKKYAPVGLFEQKTSYCPRYLAWRILDEARDYFRTPIPEAFADKLAHRAEVVFAHHPFWARKATPRAESQQQFQCWRQREFILMFMRHWLAGVLARERPALFRDLPESFKVGQPLPPHSPSRTKAPHPAPLPRAERENHRPRFVHGCELLPA
jgi:hypothetical protein